MRVKRLAVALLFLFSAVGLLWAQEVKRADYKITIPDKSIVKPRDPNIDPDHYTVIRFPNRSFLVVMVLDEKSRAEHVYNNIIKIQGKALKNGKVVSSSLFKEINGSGVQITGDLKGMKYTYQVGFVKGKKKGFVFNAGYLEADRKASLEYLTATLNSFKEL